MSEVPDPFTADTYESQYRNVHPDNIPPEHLAEMKRQIAEDGIYVGEVTRFGGMAGAIEIIEPEIPGGFLKIMPNVMPFPNDHPMTEARRIAGAQAQEHTPITHYVQTSPIASSPNKIELVLSKGLDSPELKPQHGAVAADVITLRLAAERVQEITGYPLVVPEIAGGKSDVLESLAKVTFDPLLLKVTAKIDTGKLAWKRPAEKSTLRSYYTGEIKQSALLEEGEVAVVDGCAVSNETMKLSDGREVTVWFAAVEQGEQPTRYGLVERASNFMQGFKAQGYNVGFAKRNIPAVQVKWKDNMPEIVAANKEILQGAKQEVRFALDYTGARAAASTALQMRGGGGSPVVTFGNKGPVMYWLTEPKGDVPFAVSRTNAESWLYPDEQPDFDFK